MNIKEWAMLLNGRECGNEISKDECKSAKADNIIIAFGASDDLIEFRGAIFDEISAYGGTTCLITKNYDIFNEEENRETFRYNRNEINFMKKVCAAWCPMDDKNDVWASWNITADIKNETFDIFENGELFCRGIVFNINDI